MEMKLDLGYMDADLYKVGSIWYDLYLNGGCYVFVTGKDATHIYFNKLSDPDKKYSQFLSYCPDGWV